MKKIINKLCCVICAIGTYIMAFMAAYIFERGIPMDFTSGIGIIICNAGMIYLFIQCGFDLLGEHDELTIIHDTEVTAEGFGEDYFREFFDGE